MATTRDATPPGTTDPFAGRPIRWGFIGSGHIAGQMAETIAASDGNVLAAVSARDGERARRFADRHGAQGAHEGYAALVADPQIDAVYVNTTHPFHHEQLLLAIDAGKPVLCEKPLTLNADQAHEVFAAARARGVLAMEAMWMRCQPLVLRALQIVRDGGIGEVVAVHARLGNRFDFDPGNRLFDVANGGGALLDLGVYPATFAWLFLGEPDTVQVTGSLAPTGADASVSMQWGYATGASAQVFCSSTGDASPCALVVGTTGTIAVESSFQDPPAIVVETDAGQERFTSEPNGFGPELAEFERCLRAGLLESPLVPHADTVGILQVLDAARVELGVKYPQESQIGQI
jgi:predicted dehydrogenase